MGAHLVERAHVRGAATLHVVVDNTHDLRLVFGIGQHRFQTTCLELVLQHACMPRAVGRHNAHATLARKSQIARRFARHVHQMRRLQTSRPFVAAIMPGHARRGEHLAPQILKLKRGLMQRRQIRLVAFAQNECRAIGRLRTIQNGDIEVVLIGFRLGKVDNAREQSRRSRRPQSANNSELLVILVAHTKPLFLPFGGLLRFRAARPPSSLGLLP